MLEVQPCTSLQAATVVVAELVALYMESGDTSDSVEGRLTRQQLKSASNEFDVESIHTLNLIRRNLSDISAICKSKYASSHLIYINLHYLLYTDILTVKYSGGYSCMLA